MNSIGKYDRLSSGLSDRAGGPQMVPEVKYLFVRGSLNTKTRHPVFDLPTAQTVVDRQKGELSRPERLLCWIRYFTDGVILWEVSPLSDRTSTTSSQGEAW
jgi:hypothetical protein